ncbi:MAG TPA: DUF4384 domain-containing protein [Pyrinomonadaceae bacterium]|nr:DUF4384 domain-containing protein [Pyrinomonadaceae bacterium]
MQSGLLKWKLIAFAVMTASFIFGGMQASAQNNPLVDDRPVSIVRKAKPNHRPRQPRRVVRNRPVVERAPLLKLQWRVMKVNEAGVAEEANPTAVFHSGDRLRLGVRTNQNGFLYIIHQTDPNQPGQVIFPDSRINGGRNDVTRDQEFVLPSNCPAGIAPSDCALIVVPPAGQEVFTLIFSRDLITDLPNTPAEAGGGGIPPAVLLRLRSESGQIIKRGRGTTPFSVLVVNTNTRDNEDIYETLLLNKGQ